MAAAGGPPGEGVLRRWLRGFGLLYLCVRGPRLYRVYRHNGRAVRGRGGEEQTEGAWVSDMSCVTRAGRGALPERTRGSSCPPNPSHPLQESFYQPRALEKHTDSMLAWVSVLWTISYYSSPLAVMYMYRKGFLNSSRLVPIGQYGMTLLCVLAGIVCLRGLGRWSNPHYIQFISILERTKFENTPENKRRLSYYNFDFRSWPVDFRWDETSSKDMIQGSGPLGGVSLLKSEPRTRSAGDSLLQWFQKLPCQIISYVVAHSFGRRMLYPGSVYLLQKALMPMLLQGQARLVEEYGGKRAKLLACDGNEIDTMFVDRRETSEANGQKLVICCEGNAGFYEVGCVSTPLEAGYSILGWNHPGFAGSTGIPFPQNEANAMDAVVQYAIHRLGYLPEDIIVYAWSIGGFTASWATMTYPDISALVLDASFDDLVPLALKVMPESWRGLVTRTVKKYLNLNNAEQLCRYQGPVLLIRRTQDEVITTTHPEDISSNRGNDLLVTLLLHRYPHVMSEEGRMAARAWLAASNPLQEASVISRYGVEDDWCLSVLQSYKDEHSEVFPWSVGEDMSVEEKQQLAVYLARKHLENFEGTHCTPLSPSAFHTPWRI